MGSRLPYIGYWEDVAQEYDLAPRCVLGQDRGNKVTGGRHAVGAVVMLAKHDTVEAGFQGVEMFFEVLVVKVVSLLGFEMVVWQQ